MKEGLLIRKMSGTDTTVHSTDEWAVKVTEIPFQISSEVKDLPSNDWADEDGEDEFVPDRLPLKAYEMSVGFVYKYTAGTAAANVSRFLQFLADGGEMEFYDVRTKIGRKNIRYMSFDPEADHLPEGGEDVLAFTVYFKVNDPRTEITLTAPENITYGGKL